MLAGAGALLAVLSALYGGSPWWATHRMVQAAEAGDTEKLAAYVDYPAVTADVEAQLAASFAGMKGLVGMIASKLAGQMAKALITPEKVAAMVARGRANPLDAAARKYPDTPEGDEPPRVLRSKRYRSVDVFEVRMREPETEKWRGTLVFRRHGLVGWKMAAIEFAPPEPPPPPAEPEG